MQYLYTISATNMRNKNRIKQELKYGDIQTICEVTTLSESYVKKVLSGDRNSEVVWDAAKKIINSRKIIKKELIQESK